MLCRCAKFHGKIHLSRRVLKKDKHGIMHYSFVLLFIFLDLYSTDELGLEFFSCVYNITCTTSMEFLENFWTISSCAFHNRGYGAHRATKFTHLCIRVLNNLNTEYRRDPAHNFSFTV